MPTFSVCYCRPDRFINHPLLPGLNEHLLTQKHARIFLILSLSVDGKKISKNIPHVKRKGRGPQVKILFVPWALFGMSLVTTTLLIAAVTKSEFWVLADMCTVVTGHITQQRFLVFCVHNKQILYLLNLCIT